MVTRTKLKLWTIIKPMKKLKPAHPGKLLLEEFIRPMNLSVYKVAKDSGIAQSTLAAIVGRNRSISADTAMRLGRYFQVDAQFWLNLQTRYNLMILEDKRSKIEREVHPVSKAA
jgi:antitoxin HigA-1